MTTDSINHPCAAGPSWAAATSRTAPRFSQQRTGTLMTVMKANNSEPKPDHPAMEQLATPEAALVDSHPESGVAHDLARPEHKGGDPSSSLQTKSRDVAKFKEELMVRMSKRRKVRMEKDVKEMTLNACVAIWENPQSEDVPANLRRLKQHYLYEAVVDSWPQFLGLLGLPVQEPSKNKSPSSSTAVDANQPATQARPSAPKNEQRSKLGALAADTSEAVVTNGEEAPPLSKAERKQLNRYEKTIAKGRDAMLKACKALKGIRDQRLYREKFDTFEDYCLKKWNLARSSAYQRLTLAQAHETLSATADKPVEVNERQARALGGLSDEDMVRVWKQAVKASNTQNPSTKNIKAARKELNLAPVKSGASKPSPKSSGAADQDSAPTSSQGEFDPGSRWQTFRDQVKREYEGWPQAHRVAFRDNLRDWLKEQEDGDNEAQNLASEAA